MAYYSDLSPYEYVSDESAMLNVGWLAWGHEFNAGGVSSEVFNELLRLANSKANILRGVHDCEFCSEESPIRMPASNERGYVSLGMGEIHVVGERGEVYAAPSLILHYVQAHDYRPPDEFVQAVRRLIRD